VKREVIYQGRAYHARQRIAVLALLSLLSLSLSCSRNRTPPDWSKLLKDAPPTPSQAGRSADAPRTTEDLIVYLDTSSSMVGYVSSDRQKATVFSRTLQELRNFSTLVSPPLNVYVRRVDAQVGPPLNETFLSEASINQATYNGKETNLSGAIETFRRAAHDEARAAREKMVATVAVKPEHKETGEAEKDEPLTPARFHILVTDGVQSTRQRSDVSCTTGSDQICVRKKILGLLEQGWGAYVIGLRSEFKGKLYSEINHAAIAYETRSRDPQSYRPFYLYLFSPDREALDKLVAALQERLRSLVGQDDALRVLALTSPYTEDWGKGELQVPKERDALLESSKSKEENPPRFTLKVSLDTEKAEAKPFSIQAAIDWSNNVKSSGTPQERAGLVKWNLVPIYPEAGSAVEKGMRLAEVKLVRAEPQPDGTVSLALTAQWPRANGTPEWRVYGLEGRLNLDEQTPLWIKQWSTEMDTTAEMGNRTLYLESALLGLWNNPQLKKQIVAQMYLRVGPK
jgi:hypothetical protein